MHAEAHAAVARLKPPSPQAVFEVGSLNINGSIRDLFDGARQYHGIDCVVGPDVDAVGDGATYEPPFAPDCIVCCEVLEHAAAPADIIRHLAHVLAPGGTLIVTCAGVDRMPHSAIDGGRVRCGEHYQNVEASEMFAWLMESGLTGIHVETGPGVREASYGIRGDVYARAVKR